MPAPVLPQRRDVFYLKTDIAAEDSALRQLAVSNRAEAERRCPELAAEIAECLGVPQAEISVAPGQGTFHLLHDCTLPDGRALVARSGLSTLLPDEKFFYIDTWVQRHLPEADLPAVTVRHVDCSRRRLPYDWMLMDRAAGAVLSSLPEETLEKREPMQALGAALCKLHKLEVMQGFGPLDAASLPETDVPRGIYPAWHDFAFCRWEEHLAASVAANFLKKDEIQNVKKFARDVMPELAATERVLLHGDPGNANFFMKDGKISALLDWEDALSGDSLYDVAFWATFHPRRRWAAFMEGYGATPERGSSAAARFSFYFLRITLAKVLHRRRFATPDIAGRPTARQRVEEALSLLRESMAPACPGWLRSA
jgi:Ser/Thr protein kinase RdoA (MazF antagonist)